MAWLPLIIGAIPMFREMAPLLSGPWLCSILQLLSVGALLAGMVLLARVLRSADAQKR